MSPLLERLCRAPAGRELEVAQGGRTTRTVDLISPALARPAPIAQNDEVGTLRTAIPGPCRTFPLSCQEYEL